MGNPAAGEDRISPHSKRVEQHLIGCLFCDPTILDDVVAVVSADRFYFDGHQRIVRAIVAEAADGRSFDLATVFDRLRGANEAEDAGGYEYLARCRDSVSPATDFLGLARKVREYAVYRDVIHAAGSVLRDAQNRALPADELAARAEQLFLDVTDRGGATTLTTDAELIRRRFEIIDSGGEPDGLSTGLADVDALLNGLRAQELVIIGARPSEGKTALGLTVALRVAGDGTPVLVISLEMSEQEIGDRLLTMRSGVPMVAFTGRRRVTPGDAETLVRAAAPQAGAAPIYVYDRASVTPPEIAAVIRLAVRRKKVGLVVVDYIQLVRPTNPRVSRVEQMSDVSRVLKAAARMANVPVVCLAQLNRESEKRTDPRPRKSDLRESGSLEQDADKVILIHRPAADDTGEGPQPEVVPVELVIDKNRNGPQGLATVAYRLKAMRFENAARGFWTPAPRAEQKGKRSGRGRRDVDD